MQAGSLVTPRWNKAQMIEEIGKRWPMLLMTINQLPEFGQIYEVTYIGKHCPTCKVIHVLIAGVVVTRPRNMETNMELGLWPDFYVEIDPPQENVQSMVDKIIIETPVKELTKIH